MKNHVGRVIGNLGDGWYRNTFCTPLWHHYRCQKTRGYYLISGDGVPNRLHRRDLSGLLDSFCTLRTLDLTDLLDHHPIQ